MISPQAGVASRLRDLGVDAPVEFNVPPRPELGDFSTPVALKLAKSRKRAPLQIAEELRSSLAGELPPYTREVGLSPPGFLNFFLDHPAYIRDLLQAVHEEGDRFGRSPGQATNGDPARRDTTAKILIEHTNVNPNKAMHVGHVRNAVLGDTLVRALEWAGHTVEVCNYIDDTGVQVVDVVTGLLYLDEPEYADSGEFSAVWEKAPAGTPFDYYCWDLYARVQEYIGRDAPALKSDDASQRDRASVLQARKQQVMHEIEARNTPIATFAKEVATRIVRAHLKTISRLNVYYDLLNWESDILGAGFWTTTFERLRESGAIRFEESGPNQGCWVIPMGGVTETDEGVRSKDRVLVRSNGTITYTAKDVAYQLWKFGRLDADFLYRLWSVQGNGQELWTTAPNGMPRPGYGHANRVLNVIDVRQSDQQTGVYECLDRLGFNDEAASSTHLGYEVVTLSRDAAQELGVEVGEARDVSMSGRKGLGVKADDLIDRMIDIIREKNPNLALEAEALAAAGIRYYMLRFATNTIIRFDFREASQTTGESGVYLVYSYARACSLIAKATAGAESSHGGDQFLPAAETLTEAEKTLASEMGRLSEAIQSAVDTLSTTPLTTYAFSLAAAFARFFDHTSPIVRETDPQVRAFRLALVHGFRQVMKNTLDVLGITALERI